MIRKYAENIALQKMQEQNKIHQFLEKEKKEKERLEQTVNEFKRNFRSFRWRSEDQWSKFLDTHFVYEKMDTVLLEKDKVWLEKCKTLIHLHATLTENEENEVAQYVKTYVSQLVKYVRKSCFFFNFLLTQIFCCQKKQTNKQQTLQYTNTCTVHAHCSLCTILYYSLH